MLSSALLSIGTATSELALNKINIQFIGENKRKRKKKKQKCQVSDIEMMRKAWQRD